jgi:hypothetical protein
VYDFSSKEGVGFCLSFQVSQHVRSRKIMKNFEKRTRRRNEFKYKHEIVIEKGVVMAVARLLPSTLNSTTIWKNGQPLRQRSLEVDLFSREEYETDGSPDLDARVWSLTSALRIYSSILLIHMYNIHCNL